MSQFLETVVGEFNRMRARAFADGYEGVTHAGVAVVAADTGRFLLAQRAMDETDDPDVQETWEFPSGTIEEGEDPFDAALREFSEEVDLNLPDGQVFNGWRAGPEDNYQGFAYLIPEEFDLSVFTPNDETQAVGWFSAEDLSDLRIRPEMADFDWTLLDVSGNEDEMEDEALDEEAVERIEDMTDDPLVDVTELMSVTIPIHGVIAPEEAESGDSRAFNAGSMTSRPLRIPFRWQKSDIGGHDGAVTVGSVDRIMRKGNLIHWEGRLMHTEEACELMELIQFFDNRYGVSVDGDKGSLDSERSDESGVTWFDAVRAAALTAVAIPAFAEAYVALGPHPEMPEDDSEEALTASGITAEDIAGISVFKRGKGWVTNPAETRRLHRYWTEKGQPGYAKINWGVSGDWTRCTVLVGEKIAKNSPDKMRYIKQICSQWHHDALGYWPGELGKPGNPPDTKENRRRAARHAASSETVEASEDEEASKEPWELVLTSSAGIRALPPAHYFDRHPDTGALVIEEPDENGIRRTYGYAGEWGVCHVGFDGRCVEVPEDPTDGYREFHLGRTKTSDGYINTGLITYNVKHRGAKEILSSSPEQAHFDDLKSAWAAVRLGEDERGVWFSGVVLPDVDENHLVKIEASGQVSGEWKHGALRTLLTVNVPGFPVMRSSAAFDDEGNVVALAASAFDTTDCAPSPKEMMEALAKVDAEVRFQKLQADWAEWEGK